MKKIIAAGFNPARQKVLTFEKINHGKVNRATHLEEFPVNAHLVALFQQRICGAIHFVGIELIELTNAGSRLVGNGRGVDMGVDVDDVHWCRL